MDNYNPITSIRQDPPEILEPKERSSEKKDLKGSAKIIIAGPPNSGKSVFTHALLKFLPSFSTNYIDAQPDATGLWYLDKSKEDPEEAKKLQVKGRYNPKNVSKWKDWIRNSKSRINIIDVGGKVDEYTQELCSEANAIIIISRYPEDHPETQAWINTAKQNRLNILGVYQTFLTQEDVPGNYEEEDDFRVVRGQEKDWETEGYMVGLDRRTYVSSSTIPFIAQDILNRVPSSESDEKIEDTLPAGYKLLKIEDIASLGHIPIIKRLINGVEENTVDFKPDILPGVIRQIQEKRQLNQKYALYGYSVQWFAIALIYYSYPTDVDLYDDRLEGKVIDVNPENNLPNGDGSGPLIFERVREYGQGNLVHHSKHEKVYLDESDLGLIIPPEVDLNKPVYVAGATAHWANAKIALAYARIVPAVYVFDPRVGFVCCITKDEENFPLGSVVNEPF